MSGSSNLNSFCDRGQVAVQLVSCGVLLPGLVQDCTQHSCVIAIKPKPPNNNSINKVNFVLGISNRMLCLAAASFSSSRRQSTIPSLVLIAIFGTFLYWKFSVFSLHGLFFQEWLIGANPCFPVLRTYFLHISTGIFRIIFVSNK